jgi:hypothetical protein
VIRSAKIWKVNPEKGCSTNLDGWNRADQADTPTQDENGSAGRIRTYDQPVNSRLLYR